MLDEYENFNLDGLTIEEVRCLHGDDIANSYAEWIYFNLK